MQLWAASLELEDHWPEVLHELVEELEVEFQTEGPLVVDLLESFLLESSLLHTFDLPNVDGLPHALSILVLLLLSAACPIDVPDAQVLLHRHFFDMLLHFDHHTMA